MRLLWFMQVKRQGKEWTTLGKFAALDIDEATRKALRCVRPGELIRVGSVTVNPGPTLRRGN